MKNKVLVIYQAHLSKSKINNWLEENIWKSQLHMIRKQWFNISIYYPPINTPFEEMLIITWDFLKSFENLIHKPFKSFVYDKKEKNETKNWI